MMAFPVQSMTGFASLEGEESGVSYQFDARSVNGKSLDVRLRVPAGMERTEPELRRLVGATFKRGNVTLSFMLRRGETAVRYTVNQEQLDAYIEAIQALAASGSVAAPRADGLLGLKGVIETATEESEETLEDARVLELAATLLAALEGHRREEGARIVPVILDQLAEMERLGQAIDAHPERALAAIKARFDRQLDDLLAGREGLSPERLHQEAALMATRADVREELDRLRVHIEAARDLIAEGGPVGRKLDFLCQELNRETNTICSKAPHHTITALGLELKAAVEQVREQVQNLE
ncbi:YicC family protein [Acuticoccus sp. M5D2P5]|uniref:YicC/YloC family endoribonuclease n=1 Tax=Acuticoccus kalidii TaxID=2910977 RepID=UPI001F309794|nr:YicC/YloC family endoribonuclease [Acuticoccus kalidii]MCF3935535.1 YicC family protein [Acuticoccus kalidii]